MNRFPSIPVAKERFAGAQSLGKSRRNPRFPVDSIPPDILANIFGIVLRHENARPHHLPPDLRPWLVLTHVCREWRTVAFSTPNLWNVVDIKSGNMASLQLAYIFLERSQDAPYRLYFSGNSSPDAHPSKRKEAPYEQLFLRALANASRLEELHVSGPVKSETELWKLVKQPAPRLRSFSMRLQRRDDALPLMFRNEVPNLQSVDVSFASPWTNNHFQGLTRFAIHGLAMAARPLLHAFLQFLSESPNLEELVMVSAGPRLNGGPGPNLPTVELPRLKYLEVGRCFEDCMKELIRRLIIPNTVERWLYGPRDKWEEVTRYLEPVLRSATRVVVSPFNLLPIDEFLIGVQGTTIYINDERESPKIPQCKDKQATWLENVEELVHIGGDSEGWTTLPLYSVVYWLHVLPSLRSVSLAGTSYLDLQPFTTSLGRFWGFNYYKPVRPDEPQEYFYASHLRQFHLFPLTVPTERPSRDDLIALKKMLDARIEKDRGLESVILEGVGEADLRDFQSWFGSDVVKGQWDGEPVELDIRVIWSLRH